LILLDTSNLAWTVQSILHSRNGPADLKEHHMTQYARTQIVSAFAAVVCAFITIGISVAPAVAPASGLVA
jgi:hypothetical protein